MYGGAGADVFVFLPDDARDEVRDFTVGEDRLDMSALGRIYSREAIGFVAMAGGIELRVAGEKILLFSANGRAIRPDQLSDQDLFGLIHVSPVAMADPGRVIVGSALADMLLGKAGPDQMFGGGGADTLQGGGGADTLNGETADALYDPVAAQVYRLYRATLDRAPDPGGQMGWTQRILDGAVSFPQAIAGFVSSAEFRARYGATDDAAFVTLLYNNVLDRAPDAAGFAVWLEKLALGLKTRAEVVAGFAQSREFIAALQDDLLAFMRSAVVGDQLDGGAGNNLLFGGIGADTFVFDQGFGGTQRVADLERWDYIALNGFGYASAAEAMTHLHQSGPDLVFADQGSQIIFNTTTRAEVFADMFLV